MQQGKKNVFSTDLCILILIAVACVYMFCASIPLASEARLFPQVISGVTFVFTIYAIGKQVIKSQAADTVSEPGGQAPAGTTIWF